MAAEEGPPSAVDLFCGRNVPVGAALLWCGWKVQPVDIVFGDEWDLSSVDVQEKVRKDIRLADA